MNAYMSGRKGFNPINPMAYALGDSILVNGTGMAASISGSVVSQDMGTGRSMSSTDLGTGELVEPKSGSGDTLRGKFAGY